MQFTLSTVVLALAAAVSASAVGARNGGSGSGGSGGSCNNNQEQVCCNGGVLSGCLVQVIGSSCTGQAYCCQTNAGLGSLINIQALNCDQITL